MTMGLVIGRWLATENESGGLLSSLANVTSLDPRANISEAVARTPVDLKKSGDLAVVPHRLKRH